MKLTLSFSLLIIFLHLSSCKTIDMVLHPDRYIEIEKCIDEPIVTIFKIDTVKIVNNSGIVNEAIAGHPLTKQLKFTRIGQSYSFKSGESLEIISDGINFSNATFDIETNEVTKEIKLTLVDKNFSKVILTSKCQTIERYDISIIPKIEVAKGLDPEQIVVTPMFDDSCNKIGYQIRYGSEERGCGKVAKKVLKRFNECVDKGPTPPSGGISEKCRIRKKLGLPCK